MFSSIKVLELATVLAGPSVGQFFSELGATVIKVENIKTQGDVTRSWKLKNENTDDVSAYFSSINWGKQSIALDLSKAEGQAIVHRLVEKCDIVIASYKPGDASKLKVDYQTLSSIKGDIIYGEITGYGHQNDRVGYDAVIQAEAGFMYMNGEPGNKPLKMPVALMDVLAAHQLKEGLLLAWIQKLQQGIGDYVKVSLIQSAVSALVNQATNYLVAGEIPVQKGSAHPNIAPYGDVFQTADEAYVILAVGNDKQFVNLCNVLGSSDLPIDPRFDNNLERVRNRTTLYQVLKEKVKLFDKPKLLKLLAASKVPSGGINSMQEVMEMPEVKSMLLHDEKHPEKPTGLPTFVAGFENIAKSPHFPPPPHFGEHTVQVLNGILGLNLNEINALKAINAIL